MITFRCHLFCCPHRLSSFWGVKLVRRPVWRQGHVSRTYQCLRPVCAANCRRERGAYTYSFENGALDGIATDTWRMRGRSVSLSHVPWKMLLCIVGISNKIGICMVEVCVYLWLLLLKFMSWEVCVLSLFTDIGAWN